jgi:hypothetical protein
MRAAARATTGRSIAAVLALVPLLACSAISSPASPAVQFTPAEDAATSGSGATVDAGASEAAAVDANACQPADVETFVATAYRAASGPYQNLCSTYAIGALYDYCFAPGLGSSASCDTARAAYSACYACILTSDEEDAGSDGPLLSDSTGWVRPNVAGCIELSDPSSQGLACAKAVQVLTSCNLEACEANCPVSGYAPSSLQPYVDCTQQADSTGCAPFVSGAACAQADASVGPGDGGASIAACLQTEFETFYRYAVPLFCGPPPPMPDAETSSESSSSGSSSGSSGQADGGASAPAGDAGTD